MWYVLWLWCVSAVAGHYRMTPNVDVVGEIGLVMAKSGDDWRKLARQHDVGYHELVEANPGMDPVHPTGQVVIPSRFVLPATRQGIHINLAQLRLYYFPSPQEVWTYPIGIGRVDHATPTGTGFVTGKQEEPIWWVPRSLRDEQAALGRSLPVQIPPGPDNPLGQYALLTSFEGYLIHGTNAPEGVGLRSSRGCIRMYPEDIKALFERVAVRTPLEIVHEPYQVGMDPPYMLLQASKALHEHVDTLSQAWDAVQQRVQRLVQQHELRLDTAAMEQVSRGFRGLPHPVGRIQAS